MVGYSETSLHPEFTSRRGRKASLMGTEVLQMVDRDTHKGGPHVKKIRTGTPAEEVHTSKI